jgi:hypothetical protein
MPWTAMPQWFLRVLNGAFKEILHDDDDGSEEYFQILI